MNAPKNRIVIFIGMALAAIGGFLVAWWLLPSGSSQPAGTRDGEREILYWVAPMDPNYRRDEPGKSPMGMDLVPVYADEAEAGSDDVPALRISPQVVNNIGVKTTEVVRDTLTRTIRTVGFVAPNAERIAHVHVRSEGWIERLHVEYEGARVEPGGLLFEIYSPALVSAKEEFVQSLRGGQPALVRAAETRLRALGMLPDQIDALRDSRSVDRLLQVRAPQEGYVMQLNVREGMFVEPGTTIMSLANLDTIWVDVAVFESQIGWVEAGQPASMTAPFAPARTWRGQVDYVYPTIDAETRTARVRLAFDNPDGSLKPEMYTSVRIEAAPVRNVLVVPAKSVIRTGDGERVILALGGGRFRPARVRTGVETGGLVEIAAGLSAGERIVVSGQFLIDSEASLDASLMRLVDDAPGDREMDHSRMDQSAMDHSAMDHSAMDHSAMDHAEMDHAEMDHAEMDHAEMDHAEMDHAEMDHAEMHDTDPANSGNDDGEDR
ncbi:MAG: efflux RND transporter periplasmic adaptor subunit [Wenzhouxiangellaceae bacterium]|nr:efflux RND transporter periplasmic adaptor subunit [Wenzhouxiangellaceae bacterium]